MPRPALRIRSGTPSIVDLRIKLSRLVYHHDQLKISFRQMSSHIRGGLLEAEDVFASLSIQLMKLVGLKTVEMAGEGRFSSIVINDNDRSKEHTRVSTATGSDEWPKTEKTDENVKDRILEEEHILARANKASRELMEKQKMQLMFLVHLLKQIEVQVNASQDDIFQSLSDHQASMQIYFQKAAKYVSAIHQDHETNDMSFIMLKLIKHTYDHVGLALGAVEIGVKELMGKLAEKMCGPMVNYVNDLRNEMTAGTYPSLLAIMEEIGEAMRIRGLELEDASKKVKEAEKSRLDTLSKLKGTLERMRKLEEASENYVETKKRSIQLNVTEKSMKYEEVEEDQAKDEKLLWELLRKRRKLKMPDSPFCPNGLLGIGTGDKNLKTTKIQAMKPPPISCKPPPPTRRSTRLNPQTPSISPRLPLGSSPSVATQQRFTRSWLRR